MCGLQRSEAVGGWSGADVDGQAVGTVLNGGGRFLCGVRFASVM